MAIKETKKALANRQKTIDDAVDKATKPARKKPPVKKNPYKKGSARAKLWARREADKEKK